MKLSNKKITALFISTVIFSAGFSSFSMAADYIEKVIEAPEVIALPPSNTGWYLRGDIGYSKPKFRGGDYAIYDKVDCCIEVSGEKSFDGSLKGSFLIGGGIGYQVTDYFRTDLTLDYLTNSKYSGYTDTYCADGACTTRDRSKFNALSLLANVYVDLANINGLTPYIGAGIGGTRVKWGAINKYKPDGSVDSYDGESSWRFTYALMAGLSYDLTENVKLDAGYRFRHVNGGKMHGAKWSNGPFEDKGMYIHDVRVGLRYQFAQ